MVAEPLIEVCAIPILLPRKGSQLYVVVAVTWTGSPTFAVPLGKLMQICKGVGTELVPPLRSSGVSACCWMYSCSVPPPGFLLTTAHRAPSLARWVSSIQ
jgi:hypothetical protein